MDFGQALSELKLGSVVSRSGWNGKGMYLVLCREWNGDFEAVPAPAPGRMLPFIAMFTAQGDLVPWLASQTDILADDWQITTRSV